LLLRIALIAERQSGPGVERDRLLETCQRLLDPPQRRQDVTAVVVSGSALRIDRKCGIDVSQRFGMTALLAQDRAQKMQTVEMSGVDFQDAPKRPFRLRKPPGLAQCGCLIAESIELARRHLAFGLGYLGMFLVR